jgi:hypothetical protein
MSKIIAKKSNPLKFKAVRLSLSKPALTNSRLRQAQADISNNLVSYFVTTNH